MGARSGKSRRVLPRVDGEPVANRKTSATLHESVCFSKKRAPRCMGTLVFRTVSRQPARPDPATRKATQGHPRRRPRPKTGERRALENKAPERQNAKTGLQEMERTATDGRGLSENKAPERQSCKTIKTTKPQILENVTRESGDAEVTPSTLSATLHGNACLCKKMSATLHGSAFA